MRPTGLVEYRITLVRKCCAAGATLAGLPKRPQQSRNDRMRRSFDEAPLCLFRTVLTLHTSIILPHIAGATDMDVRTRRRPCRPRQASAAIATAQGAHPPFGPGPARRPGHHQYHHACHIDIRAQSEVASARRTYRPKWRAGRLTLLSLVPSLAWPFQPHVVLNLDVQDIGVGQVSLPLRSADPADLRFCDARRDLAATDERVDVGVAAGDNPAGTVRNLDRARETEEE